MSANRLPWDDLRLILAVGRAGSLSGAARELGVNHSTVFRRLGVVEDRLGVRLFERFRDGYAPTAAGDTVVALAQRMETEVLAVERMLAGEDLRPSGVVRVTTTETLLGFLTPIFAAFRAACPEITLEVIASDAFFNLTRRDADVAIRPAAEAPETLVGRRLATIATAIYGSADYLVSHPASDDLCGHDWVEPEESLAHLASARWLEAAVPGARITYRASTLTALLEGAKAGFGLAALPCFLAEPVPRLVRVRPPMPDMETGLWLLTHPALRRTARVRAVLDFVAPAISACRPLLEGSGGRM